ncbi:helix-turn-helix domain-containing protein [Sphingomonas sp. 37zxx]|uniref:helix-turn-helix domain-containing protein n=1 Tax=Sphingomonas sp. 37zxx TaxID=1550073 RepID=UPI001E34783D|nr:helix-turn-helix domain-containing protein [Sphingomonas sp. 37zxx]
MKQWLKAVLEHFSTRTVPAERRYLFWRDLVAETFPGMTVEPKVGIRADLARWELGRLAMARAHSDQSRVNRHARQQDDRHLILHLQRQGRMMLSQGNRTSLASRGDIVVADGSTPYSIDISHANDCLIVSVPFDLMQPMGTDRPFHAHLLPGRDPQVAVLQKMIEGLWLERETLDQVDQGMDQVIGSLTRMALLRCTPEDDDTSHDQARGIIDYVERHLYDPGLGTAQIALATGLSTRAVQKCFARQLGATPTAFISQRRLERAAQMLDARPYASVTEIAFALGYNDSAFFSRCFRRQHGVSPRHWRERAGVAR